MADFNDYLNDYSLNNDSEEQLEPPVVSGSYDSYAANDSYGYSDSRYDDRYQDSYSNDYRDDSSYDRADSRYDRDDDEEYDKRFADDYEDRPSKKSFKPSVKFGGGSSSEGKASVSAPSNGILTILVAACVIISVITLASLGGIKKSVNEMGDSLSSQISSLAAQTSELAERVSALETGVTTVQENTTAQTSSKYITITKQPTSVTSYVGRGEDSLAKFFEVVAKGNGVGVSSFVWQKQDASGNWVSVGFDGTNSRNESYGLQNEVNKYDSGDYAGCYYSIIYSFGLTSAAFGQYRCMISDSTGEVAYSDIIEIRNQN